MRRTATLMVLLGLITAVSAGAGSSRTAQTSKLRLLATNPLTIAGAGFHSRDRTRITATSAGRTQVVVVTATRLGDFRVAFHELAPSRCDLIRVVAVSRAGTQTVLKRLPPRACIIERSQE